jgi:tRNA (mo5U34)-methyltransferase
MSTQLLLEDKSIRWHQKFELGSTGVFTPGFNSIEHLFELAGIPKDLTGSSVLDIGTTNGGSAFLCEQRGARHIIAVDICDPDVFGFDKISKYLNSNVEFIKSSVYELPERLNFEKFDLVFFWGVLYHLRHPLLAMDALNQITGEMLTIETVISSSADSSASFFRKDQLSNDGSNWWAPSETCLLEFCQSAGFNPVTVSRWDAGVSERILVNAKATHEPPEYLSLSYEREISGVKFSSRNPTRLA